MGLLLEAVNLVRRTRSDSRTEAKGAIISHAMPRSPIPSAEHRCSTLEHYTNVLAGALKLSAVASLQPSSIRCRLLLARTRCVARTHHITSSQQVTHLHSSWLLSFLNLVWLLRLRLHLQHRCAFTR